MMPATYSRAGCFQTQGQGGMEIQAECPCPAVSPGGGCICQDGCFSANIDAAAALRQNSLQAFFCGGARACWDFLVPQSPSSSGNVTRDPLAFHISCAPGPLSPRHPLTLGLCGRWQKADSWSSSSAKNFAAGFKFLSMTATGAKSVLLTFCIHAMRSRWSQEKGDGGKLPFYEHLQQKLKIKCLYPLVFSPRLHYLLPKVAVKVRGVTGPVGYFSHCFQDTGNSRGCF